MRRFAFLLLLSLPLFAQLPAGVERHRYGHDGSDPVNLVATTDGVLWAASSNVTVLERFDTDGIQTHFYLPFEAFTSDMTLGSDGALWLAAYGSVTRYDRETNLAQAWNEFHDVRHILSGPDGNIWFVHVPDPTHPDASRLVRFNTEGVVLGTFAFDGTIAGAVFGSDGALWLSMSEAGTSRLVRLTTAGERTEYAIERASPLFGGPDFLWTAFPDRIVRLNLRGAIVGTYRVAMTPAAADALGNLWLRTRTGDVEEVAQLTPGGVLTRFSPWAALPSVLCIQPGYGQFTVPSKHGGFAVFPDGRAAMIDYYDYSNSRNEICRAVDGTSVEKTLTILDPAIAPVASVEQLNTVPRRRIARR